MKATWVHMCGRGGSKFKQAKALSLSPAPTSRTQGIRAGNKAFIAHAAKHARAQIETSRKRTTVKEVVGKVTMYPQARQHTESTSHMNQKEQEKST